MRYVLGIDLGTSSLKGLLLDQKGNVVCSSSCDYPLITPMSGYSEQNPKDWVRAIDVVIKDILKKKPEAKECLEGISFSGQMHSLVLLDNQDEVLRNAILWNDVRTTKQCNEIMEHYGDELISITKNMALEGFTLPKILWVKENEPKIFEKVDTFLLPKDYLGFYLTGNKQMEFSDAAGTLLLDMNQGIWSKEILDTFNIKESICPKLVKSYDCIGNLSENLKEKYGFINNVAVFSGGADNACAAIGAGIISEGTAMSSIGTSGVFLSYEDDNKKDYQGKLHYFNHVNDHYYSMGVTLSAGNSLAWFVKEFAKGESFDEVLKNIKNIPVGSEGLLFTPYIMGERSPHVDSKIRGAFIGLDARHTRDHLARSVVEGITFSLKDSQYLMESIANKTFDRIICVGGGAKNDEWLQIQANVFNATMVTLTSEQGPALGAAIIAAYGLHWYDSFEECVKMFVSYDKIVEPNKEDVKVYEKVYQIYKKRYMIARRIYHMLL